MKSRRWTAMVIIAMLAVLLSSSLPAWGAPLPASQTVHIVRWGENLNMIARQYGTTVNAIVQANGLSNPNYIYVGQRLVIPVDGAPPPVPPSGTTYTIRVGDSLTSIAQRFGTTIRALMDANAISNPNLIYVGQVLRIPGAAPPSTTSYTVRAGDTLSSIAYRFGTTVSALVQLNNLPNSWYIYVGQVLRIPVGAAVPPQQPAASYHTVRQGETLTRIAMMYGTSVWALVQANNLRNASLIYPGQVLVIPGQVLPPAPPPSPPLVPTASPPYPPTPPPYSPPPPPPPTPPAYWGQWMGRITQSDCTDQDTWEHRSVIRVSVIGLKDLPVKVSSNGFETTGLTGTKPEYGEYAVEFAPFNQGIYTITPEGLGTSIQVRLDGRCTAYVEFVRLY